MVSVRLSVAHVTLLLLACIGVITFLQVDLASGGMLRWSGYSVLTPVVAGALLPVRQTLLIGLVNLAVAGCVYGFVVQSLPTGARVVVLSAVLTASLVALIVCRIRLDREERLTRLMVARDRLNLLSLASSRIGNTLDVVRTARQLAEVAVPRFADFATVDLFDSVLHGGEPETGPFEGMVSLRRVAHRAVRDDPAQGPDDLADSDVHPEVMVPARCLTRDRSARAAGILQGAEARTWLGKDRRRAEQDEESDPCSGITIPLISRGATLGVAVFIRDRRPQAFDPDDLLLSEEIAARAATCLDNAGRYTREHNKSLMLQRSLLPLGLSKHSAVETASRYLPAGSDAGVGGDWFDIIPLSSARVALVVGDVVGHGMHATATMGRLRAAVRTLADIDLPPDELLTHLDDVVTRLGAETETAQDASGADPEGMSGGEIGATCLYAVYDPVSSNCTLARAGHPPPALVRPDGGAEFIDVPTGPPLGLSSLPFESVEVLLPEGSVLALYTDGLVASRDRDMDSGLAQLTRALSGSAPGAPLQTTCDAVVKTLLDDRQSDDIALLLARTRTLDAQHVVAWDLPAEPAAVAQARELTTARLASWGLQDAAFTTELVVSELVTNAIRHAEPPIKLRLIREKALICEVSDGSSTAPHLRRARSLDEGGRGLFIVAQLTDRWGTRHSAKGKTIWSEISLAPPV